MNYLDQLTDYFQIYLFNCCLSDLVFTESQS
jgi:hypothetical protein